MVYFDHFLEGQELFMNFFKLIYTHKTSKP
jgi:hypothetical protein